MKLFYSPASPFARKVRAAAIELGLGDLIELELQEVAPGKANDAFAQGHNPLRKIPALVTAEGRTLFDSTVICDYLDAMAGGGKLVPQEGEARWQVLTAHALAQGVCEATLLVRYETVLRPEQHRWPLWIADQWDRVDAGLAWFERNPAVLEGPVNLAHLALGATLGYLDLRFPDHGWQAKNPGVAAWYAGLMQRPSFAQTRPEIV